MHGQEKGLTEVGKSEYYTHMEPYNDSIGVMALKLEGQEHPLGRGWGEEA